MRPGAGGAADRPRRSESGAAPAPRGRSSSVVAGYVPGWRGRGRRSELGTCTRLCLAWLPCMPVPLGSREPESLTKINPSSCNKCCCGGTRRSAASKKNDHHHAVPAIPTRPRGGTGKLEQFPVTAYPVTGSSRPGGPEVSRTFYANVR